MRTATLNYAAHAPSFEGTSITGIMGDGRENPGRRSGNPASRPGPRGNGAAHPCEIEAGRLMRASVRTGSGACCHSIADLHDVKRTPIAAAPAVVKNRISVGVRYGECHRGQRDPPILSGPDQMGLLPCMVRPILAAVLGDATVHWAP